MTQKIDIIPKIFKLQWHITERCNFRCKHCYQERYDTSEMDLSQMENVLGQYIDLVKKWKLSRGQAAITITGGEPFLHKDFFPFLAKIRKRCDYYSWAILSNGSLLTKENAKILKLFQILDYQISLEGMENNNDEIRGEGNFKKALKGLEILSEAGIPAVVSMTVTKKNIGDVFPLADLLSKMGVQRFLVRRLVPWGTGAQFSDALLEPKELADLYRELGRKDKELSARESSLRIPAGCENGFLWEDYESRGSCAVNTGRILALLPNGDVLACRRMPIKVGNILESPLEKIYYSDKLKEMRNADNLPKYCREKCERFKSCLGGAKCITYAYSGRLDIPDVQCPLAQKNLDKNLCLHKIK